MVNPKDQLAEIEKEIEIFQEELLEIVDDCMSDWSYIAYGYNRRFEEFKNRLKEIIK